MIRKKKPDYILTAAVIFGLVMWMVFGSMVGTYCTMIYYNNYFIITPKR